jgi:rhodanese-related sulfurtransferase
MAAAALLAACDSGKEEGSGGVEKVTYEDLKASIDAGDDMVLIDVRPVADWAGGHIQNAISIPLDALVDAGGDIVDSGKALTSAAPDKGKRIVTYCFGYGNDLTFAEAAIELGYTDVARYEWGTGEWSGDKGDYLVNEYDGFKKWHDAKSPFTDGKNYLIDVLPAEWYTGDDPQHPGGHIPGAVSVPLEQFADMDGTLIQGGKAFGDVVKDKAATVVVYCGNITCGKSLAAARAAVAMGYSHVLRYQGGWQEWQDKGNSLKAGSEP